MNAQTTDAVRELLRAFMRKWLDDVPDPAERELEGLVAPFHDALVPGIRLLNERGFSTRLGNLHERIAEVIAADVHADVRQPLDLTGTIPVLSREFITQRVAQLERRQASPDALYERRAAPRTLRQRGSGGHPNRPLRADPQRRAALLRHSYALPFFDFANEVKMGEQFWDFIGGSGTCAELLAVYVQIGEEFAPEIEAFRER